LIWERFAAAGFELGWLIGKSSEMTNYSFVFGRSLAPASSLAIAIDSLMLSVHRPGSDLMTARRWLV
jgi:hypothetical protein